MRQATALGGLLLQGAQRLAVAGQLRRQDFDGDPRLLRACFRKAPIERLVDDAHAAAGYPFLQYETVAKNRPHLHLIIGILWFEYVGRNDIGAAERIVIGRLVDSAYGGRLVRLFPGGVITARWHLLRDVAIEHRLDELKGLLAQCAGIKTFLQDPADLRLTATAGFEQAADGFPDLGEHLNLVLFTGQPVFETRQLVGKVCL